MKTLNLLVSSAVACSLLLSLAALKAVASTRVCVSGGQYGVYVRNSQRHAIATVPAGKTWCGRSNYTVGYNFAWLDKTLPYYDVEFDNGVSGYVGSDAVIGKR